MEDIQLNQQIIMRLSLFLSGKLLPYDSKDNIVKFNKFLLNEFAEEFNLEELDFAHKLANRFSEKYYFNILDDLFSTNHSMIKLNNNIYKLLLKYTWWEAFIKDNNIHISNVNSEKEIIQHKDIVELSKNNFTSQRLSKFFTWKLPNSEAIDISDFIKLLDNINISELYMYPYTFIYGHMKKDYDDLFSDIISDDDWLEKIIKILDYFELSHNMVIEMNYEDINKDSKLADKQIDNKKDNFITTIYKKICQ